MTNWGAICSGTPRKRAITITGNILENFQNSKKENEHYTHQSSVLDTASAAEFDVLRESRRCLIAIGAGMQQKGTGGGNRNYTMRGSALLPTDKRQWLWMLASGYYKDNVIAFVAPRAQIVKKEIEVVEEVSKEIEVDDGVDNLGTSVDINNGNNGNINNNDRNTQKHKANTMAIMMMAIFVTTPRAIAIATITMII